MDLPERLFSKVPQVRYVAISDSGEITLHQRPSIENSSDATSDRYEELLVNPAILLLAKQRGNIDCGGLKYVLIRYGNFFQYVVPKGDGHVSIAIEPDANIDDSLSRIDGVLDSA